MHQSPHVPTEILGCSKPGGHAPISSASYTKRSEHVDPEMRRPALTIPTQLLLGHLSA